MPFLMDISFNKHGEVETGNVLTGDPGTLEAGENSEMILTSQYDKCAI